MIKIVILLMIALAVGGYFFTQSKQADRTREKARAKQGTEKTAIDRVVKSEEDWKKILTPEQYYVVRRKGTERAFSGQFWNHHEKGVYLCVACGQELFNGGKNYTMATGTVMEVV